MNNQIIPTIAVTGVLTITDADGMVLAVQALSELNKFLDGLTEEKERLTKPLNATLKEIRGRYKETEDKLETAIADLKKKMGAYQTSMLLVQKAQEQKIADQLASGKIKKVETAIRKLEAIDYVDTKVLSDAGSVGFKPLKKFEVISMKDLPLEYHLADEVKIRKQMNAGVGLPGVRYFTELSIINKRK